MLKLIIFAPNNEKLVTDIIKAASDAGAGVMGTYTNTAFVSTGIGRWMSGKDSNPYIGKPGTLSKVEEARIEMLCKEELALEVKEAVKKVHPYEEPAIEFYKIED